MRITEAVADLAESYPEYSRSKIKTCLKLEMQKLDADDPAILRRAVASCREVIDNGALMTVPRMPHADVTANEVQARVGKSAQWKAANPIGYMATKGIRPGPTDSEIAAADNEAEKIAAAWRQA